MCRILHVMNPNRFSICSRYEEFELIKSEPDSKIPKLISYNFNLNQHVFSPNSNIPQVSNPFTAPPDLTKRI